LEVNLPLSRSITGILRGALDKVGGKQSSGFSVSLGEEGTRTGTPGSKPWGPANPTMPG